LALALRFRIHSEPPQLSGWRQQMVWFCSIAAQTQPIAGRRKPGLAETLNAIWISHLHLDHCWRFGVISVWIEVGATNPRETKAASDLWLSWYRKFLKAIDKSNNYGLLTQPFPRSSLHEVQTTTLVLK